MVNAKAIVASTALMVSAVAAQGNAIVVNACSKNVALAAVPAMGSPANCTEEDVTLAPGDKWSQQWSAISNGGGWSIKLNYEGESDSDIMQYEYTYTGTDIIWYDLSDVNGNPWDGNWEITATSPSSTCEPKQAAYRYATDDAYGMQACNSDADITVTLCSGDSSDDSAASSLSVSAAAASSTASVASTSSAEAVSAVETVASSYSTSSISTTSSTEAAVSTSLTPTTTVAQTTTFATSTVAASTSDGSPVGPVETVYETDIHTKIVFATETEGPHGQHWQREATPVPHAHRHAHAARHPHAR